MPIPNSLKTDGAGRRFTIKEHFHKLFDCEDVNEAYAMLEDCWTWSKQGRAWNLHKWFDALMDQEAFWNYFKYKVTTGLSEGINRVIKGLKCKSSTFPALLNTRFLP